MYIGSYEGCDTTHTLHIYTSCYICMLQLSIPPATYACYSYLFPVLYMHAHATAIYTSCYTCMLQLSIHPAIYACYSYLGLYTSCYVLQLSRLYTSCFVLQLSRPIYLVLCTAAI
jgi:hypothetical protein